MRQTFTAAKWASLEQVGYIEPIPGVKLGRTFAAELALLRPYAAFANSDVPTRIIHGTADRRVSHDVTRQYAMAAGRVDFVSIEDADHAFIPEPEERRSFELITDWLLRPDAAAGDADDTGLTVRRGDDMVAP
jgi:pimeloyl-ACP methyl ester carboxylesterase